MSVAERLTKKFGANLSESLGVRTHAPAAPGPQAVATVSPDDGRARQREAGLMEIDRIVPDPNQPRKEFDPDALARLAESLKRHGQLLPVRVRWTQDLGKWVIISGERRYQAAKRAGLTMLACIFVDRPLTPAELLQEQIVENMLREDLKPVEQAQAYKTLMEIQGWNGAQLADALHVSKATVSRVLALLKLPDDVRQQVDRGEIPATAAYEVAKLPTEDARREMARRIVSEEFTRKEAVEAVRERVDRLEAEQVAPPEVTTATPRIAQAAGPAESVSSGLEFRGETPELVAPAAVEQPVGDGAGEGSGREPTLRPLDAPQGDDLPAVAPTPAPAKKKPGRPRSGSKEASFRVDGAKVVVSFARKVPDAEEVVAALEQALAKARQALVKPAEAA